MWEHRFATPEYVFGTEPASFLTQRADVFPAGASILSVAEGEGRNAVWLAAQGCQVTALEYAPSAIAKAHRLAAARGVTVDVIEADVRTHDWPTDAFDITLGVFIQFAGPDDRRAIFDGMARATRPGGRIALHGYTPKQLDYRTGGPGRLENLYTPEILTAAFPGWRVEVCEGYERVLDEGTGHSGRSALIDFVAVKPG